MKRLRKITYLGDYINGAFIIPPEKSESFVALNPGNLDDDVIGEFHAAYDHIYQAVNAARAAFPKWSVLTASSRANHLNKLYSEIESHLNEIAETISRETGKPFWEAEQEAKGLLGKIQITIKEGMKLIEEKEISDAYPKVTGRYRYKPKGVMAVMGPFNFPLHLPQGHFIPALLTGNTVVFKPSEKTPASGQIITEMIHRSGFPPGVFNLIQGGAEVGKRLCLSSGIDGILFTGSYEVGLKIKKETASHFWKTPVLEMGGKNASIICDDADLDKALYENILGAYLTTGQRCSATSRMIATEKIADLFVKEFHQLSKMFKIGYAFDDDPPFMGPLISEMARDNYLRFQGIAQREGGELVMRGKTLELKYRGYYVTPSIYLFQPKDPPGTYLTTEIFGPSVGIVVVKGIDEAIQEANKTDYGLVVSVFTKDRRHYEKVFHESKAGLVNWNRSTVGGSSRLPFGGQGKSGNQFPTALFAPYYCTYPVASLEDSNPVDENTIPPGFPFRRKNR